MTIVLACPGSWTLDLKCSVIKVYTKSVCFIERQQVFGCSLPEPLLPLPSFLIRRFFLCIYLIFSLKKIEIKTPQETLVLWSTKNKNKKQKKTLLACTYAPFSLYHFFLSFFLSFYDAYFRMWGTTRKFIIFDDERSYLKWSIVSNVSF